MGRKDRCSERIIPQHYPADGQAWPGRSRNWVGDACFGFGLQVYRSRNRDLGPVIETSGSKWWEFLELLVFTKRRPIYQYCDRFIQSFSHPRCFQISKTSHYQLTNFRSPTCELAESHADLACTELIFHHPRRGPSSTSRAVSLTGLVQCGRNRQSLLP